MELSSLAARFEFRLHASQTEHCLSRISFLGGDSTERLLLLAQSQKQKYHRILLGLLDYLAS